MTVKQARFQELEEEPCTLGRTADMEQHPRRTQKLTDWDTPNPAILRIAIWFIYHVNGSWRSTSIPFQCPQGSSTWQVLCVESPHMIQGFSKSARLVQTETFFCGPNAKTLAQSIHLAHVKLGTAVNCDLYSTVTHKVHYLEVKGQGVILQLHIQYVTRYILQSFSVGS